MKALDLTNQKFGKLTVLSKAPKRNDKYTRWICRCECDSIVEVRTDYLRSGHTKSCGCEKKKYFNKLNLVGQTFGYLTVLEPAPPIKQKCQCKCGNIVYVETGNLTSGNTKSCGCYQKERTSEASFKDLTNQRFGKLVVLEKVGKDRFNHTRYKCQCDCGGIAIVDVSNLTRGNTCSCGCIKSKGEMIINQWLQNHNINFIPQYSHDKIILESGRRPFFDFAIFDKKNNLKCFIEYNGKQHYEVTGGWNTKEYFEKTQKRDLQKREWCKKLSIPLYEIKYDENILQRIEGIVKEVATEPDMEEAEALLAE